MAWYDNIGSILGFGGPYQPGLAAGSTDLFGLGGQSDNQFLTGLNNDMSTIGGYGQGGFGAGLSGIGDIMGGLAGLGGAYVGLKQLGLAEDQFDFTKDITNRNLFNQAQITNAAMKDRQNARLGSAGTSNAPYQGTSNYMADNSVSGRPV